jgi:divalent metal cation (Fe/Co/Zn/Cd) transporter
VEPGAGRDGSFLHLSLHLTIEEQLSIDQPHGIREQYQRILEKASSEHEAKHRVLECLAETVWHAQRHGTAPDSEIYLEYLRRQAS